MQSMGIWAPRGDGTAAAGTRKPSRDVARDVSLPETGDYTNQKFQLTIFKNIILMFFWPANAVWPIFP